MNRTGYAARGFSNRKSDQLDLVRRRAAISRAADPAARASYFEPLEARLFMSADNSVSQLLDQTGGQTQSSDSLLITPKRSAARLIESPSGTLLAQTNALSPSAIDSTSSSTAGGTTSSGSTGSATTGGANVGTISMVADSSGTTTAPTRQPTVSPLRPRSGADFRYVLRPGTGFTGPTTQPEAVGNPGDTGYSVAVTAHWDVVPNQAFSGFLNVAVDASHVNGIDRVEFSANGGTWVPVSTTSKNPDTGASEYNITLNTADFSGGSVELRAVAYPKIAGVPTVLNTIQLPAPAAPGNLATTVFSAARIDLTWADNSSNEMDFRIDRSSDGVTFTPIATVAADLTTYSDTGLTPDTHYYYRVRAENGGGYSLSQTRDAKTKLNATVDGDGWTTIVPSSDSRTIYVSSSQGNDANSGLSINSPVKTIAKAKTLASDRGGMPDQILLKRGDAWNESLGDWNSHGRSATEPFVISGYGVGARPILNTTDGSNALDGIGAANNNLAIVGVDFECVMPSASGRPTGIYWLSPGTTSLLIEDCVFHAFANGIVLNGYAGTMHNISVRRNIVTDSYTATAHSEGLYATNVDGLTLVGNLFDHNGWNPEQGVAATVFNHNVYMDSNLTRVTVRDNIFANASSHGLQARSGGDIENNLFIGNPIGMSFGYVNGDVATSGGITGKVSGNVFIGDRDIAGSLRGWAIEVGNIKSGGGTMIENNLFTGDTQNSYAAIRLDFGSVDNPTQAVGINDLTIQSNTISGWNSALWLNSNLVLGGSGQSALNGLVVKNNDFQNLLSGRIIDHGPSVNASVEQWLGNRYYASGSPGGWFTIGGTAKSWSNWQSTVDQTGTSQQITFLDTNRNIATYSGSIGLAATVDALLTASRQESKAAWDLRYTAGPVINYLVAGFSS